MTQKEKELENLPKDAHHPFGMSTWSPRFKCPCWDGKQGESKNAQTGTECHALFAETLSKYLATGNAGFISKRLDEDGLDYLEKGALMACLRVIAKYLAGVNGAKAYVEKPVETFFGIWGRADLIITAPGKLTVVDFKTFYNPGRDHFPQLAGYAIGALCTLGLGEEFAGTITLATVYGDNPDKDVEREVSHEELSEFDSRAVEITEDRHAGDAKPVQCNWCELCAHAPACPALRKVAVAVTVKEHLRSIPENWASLTPEKKAQSLVLAEVVTKWADAVKAVAKESALNGEVIADEANGIHYALVNRAGRKTPRTRDFLAVATGRRIPLSACLDKLTITATNAVAVFKEAGMKKKEADELVASISDIGEGTTALLRR